MSSLIISLARVLLGLNRLVIAGLCALLAAPAFANQITVFAAASLKDALEEVSAAYEQDTGREVILSFAGSSVLARQIEYGAPADVFISANRVWMDHLEGRGLLVDGSRRDLLGNALVLVGHGGKGEALEAVPVDLSERLDGGRLAMALVSAVPAGIYGKAALEHLGLWADVAPFVAQTDNVRAAFALVARGEAPLGIVYRSDTEASDEVHVVATFPPESHAPIVYPAAVLARGQEQAAQAFLDFLATPNASAVFKAHGFDPVIGGGDG